MSVTIQASELMQPHGELSCDSFPNGVLDSFIGGWIIQATKKVEGNANIKADDHNDAATQYTYYLAYDYRAQNFAAMPNSVSVNQGADSISYGQDRPTFWANKAANALAAYNGYINNLVKRGGSYTGPVTVRVGY